MTEHYNVNWQQNYLFTTAINSRVCLNLLLNQTDAILLIHLSHFSQLMTFYKIKVKTCAYLFETKIKHQHFLH